MSIHNEGKVSTELLRTKLRSLLKISNDQEKQLKDRNDFSFDQIVRNFKSHSKNKGNILHEQLAIDAGRGYFQITEKGK